MPRKIKLTEEQQEIGKEVTRLLFERLPLFRHHLQEGTRLLECQVKELMALTGDADSKRKKAFKALQRAKTVIGTGYETYYLLRDLQADLVDVISAAERMEALANSHLETLRQDNGSV